jgi:hypothetical protein
LNHSTYLLFYLYFILLRLKTKRQPLVIASHRIALRRSAAHRQIYRFRIAISSLQTVTMTATAPSNAWLRSQRKSDLVELAENVGLQK